MSLKNIFKIKTSSSDAKERLTVCSQCPYYDSENNTCGVPAWKTGAKAANKIQYKKQEYQLCGCLMPMKVHLAMATCPIGLWNSTKHDEIRLMLDNLNLSSVTEEDFKEIKNNHRYLFGPTSDNKKKKLTNCKSCVVRMIDEINFLINNTNTNVERRIKADS